MNVEVSVGTRQAQSVLSMEHIFKSQLTTWMFSLFSQLCCEGALPSTMLQNMVLFYVSINIQMTRNIILGPIKGSNIQCSFREFIFKLLNIAAIQPYEMSLY